MFLLIEMSEPRVRVVDYSKLKRALESAVLMDPKLATVIELVGYPSPRIRPAEFVTLLQVIVSQQVSTRAASAINDRLLKLCGGKVTWRKILNRSGDQLRECGLSQNKVDYVRGLAEKIRTKELDLELLKSMDTDSVIAHLVKVRGLGRWSAEIFAMFALGHRDVFPVDDLALQVAVQRYHGLRQKPSPKETARLAEKWSPERSAVALLMWKYYGATTLN